MEPPKPPPPRRRPWFDLDQSAVVAAVITAAASLLIYSLQQITHIDERLDRLEQEARVLLDGAGQVRPSDTALKNFFHIESILRRIDRLEGKHGD